MKKTVLYIVFGAILFTFLSLVIPKQYFYNPVKGGIVTVFSPIQNFLSSIYFNSSNFWQKISRIRELQSENDKLKQEIEKLNHENSQLIEIRNENDILRDQLGFARHNRDLRLLTAEVVSRDPNNFLQYITINKGANSSIEQGMPVISGGYLVGKISQVYDNLSSVQLVTNPNSVINSLIQQSRATGVVKGELGFGLKLELVPQDAKINIGDRVVTSGLGDTLPKGLIIGTVTEVKSIQSEIFQTAEVRPEVNINKLEIIFIVLEQ